MWLQHAYWLARPGQSACARLLAGLGGGTPAERRGRDLPSDPSEAELVAVLAYAIAVVISRFDQLGIVGLKVCYFFDNKDCFG